MGQRRRKIRAEKWTLRHQGLQSRNRDKSPKRFIVLIASNHSSRFTAFLRFSEKSLCVTIKYQTVPNPRYITLVLCIGQSVDSLLKVTYFVIWMRLRLRNFTLYTHIKSEPKSKLRIKMDIVGNLGNQHNT